MRVLEPVTAYQYAAELVRIQDADSQIYSIDLGFRVRLHQAPIRLLGLNAPEDETAAGIAAESYVVEWFRVNAKDGKVTLHTRKPADGDKYGRWLALVVGTTGRCLNKDMLSAGMAAPYL